MCQAVVYLNEKEIMHDVVRIEPLKADAAERLLATSASFEQANDHLSNLLDEVRQMVGT